MTNRVDQADVPGALRNHEIRIRVLEAVPPPAAVGLPPWFSWTPTIKIPVAAGGTAPTVTSNFAWLMVQTVSGDQFPTGSPLLAGTVLGQTKVTLTDAGTIASPYDLVPEFQLAVSSAVGTYRPIIDDVTEPVHAIGHGWIRQASTGTVLGVQLLATGELMVTNVPDLADLSGAAGGGGPNMCRLANPIVSPEIPAFPWDWVSGDQISVNYQYPIGFDL